MPPGNARFDTFASETVNDDGEQEWHTLAVPPDILCNGENLIAVELHQHSLTSSDSFFDLSFISNSRWGAEIVARDEAAIESLLTISTALTVAQKQELRAVFGTDPGDFPPAVSLARASRFFARGELENARRALENAPAAPDGTEDWPPAAAKTKLLKLIDSPAN